MIAWHRTSEASRRLETIPGIGVIATTAIASTGTDALSAHRPEHLASVALANRMARIAWAVLVRGEAYRAPAATTA